MYDLIFNQLKVESLRRFLKINKIDSIKLNQKKQELVAAIKDMMSENEDVRNMFINFLKEVEIGGRKDFWFFKFKGKLSAQEIHSLRNKVDTIDRDGSDIITPSETDTPKYFILQSDTDTIKAKVIRKKIIQEKDKSRTTKEGGETHIVYVDKEIRHVTYIHLNLLTETLLCGVDVWEKLNSKLKLQELKDDLEYIFGTGFIAKIESIDVKEKIKTLLNNKENVITRKLSSKDIDKWKNGTDFTIDTGRSENIKKGLNKGDFKIEDIKTKFIEDDVRDNSVYKAAASNNIQLDTLGGIASLFYYHDKLESYEYVRFEAWANECRVKFLNDHLMLEDINYVFSEII